MSIATTVGDALAFEEIDFKILRHAAAADAARQAEISPERLAKAVLLKDAHGYLLTVLRAATRWCCYFAQQTLSSTVSRFFRRRILLKVPC